MSVFDGYDDFGPESGTDPLTDPLTDFYQAPVEQDVIYGRHARRSVEDDIAEALEVVRSAKSVPLSASAMVPREDLLAILEDALRNLPDEIREARWALREREALMAEEQRKIDNMIELAQAEALKMVESTEIVRQARLKAQQILADAEGAARKMVNEHEDFLDMKLADFENSMNFLLKTVQRGRARLASQPLPEPTQPSAIADQFFAGSDTQDPSAPFDYDADIAGSTGDF
jgi:vacuolar-type H+-ATPase subunit H